MVIMGKRFIKFRVSKVIPSFKSCRSKDPSSLPSNPVPSFLRAPTNNAPPPQKQPHHHFSLKRHVSSALISARRSFSRPRASHESSRTQSSLSSSLFKWEKQPKWHVIAKIPDISANEYNYDSTPPRQKIYNSAASSDSDAQSDVIQFPPLKTHKRRRMRQRRRSLRKVRVSTSSDSGLFTDGEETENLVSTDSSTCGGGVKKRRSSVGEAAPARLSEFMRKMVPCRATDEVVEGKVRDSFAVVKRSEDPYEDFKRSMVEMVVEMQMFEKKDLEELLRCFLSLNSECHHGVIVRAFVEIWETVFGSPQVVS